MTPNDINDEYLFPKEHLHYYEELIGKYRATPVILPKKYTEADLKDAFDRGYRQGRMDELKDLSNWISDGKSYINHKELERLEIK